MILYCTNCNATVDAKLKKHETLQLPTLTCPRCDSAASLKQADYAREKQ